MTATELEEKVHRIESDLVELRLRMDAREAAPPVRPASGFAIADKATLAAARTAALSALGVDPSAKPVGRVSMEELHARWAARGIGADCEFSRSIREMRDGRLE